MKLSLYKKNSINKYDWWVKSEFFSQESLKGKSIEDVQSICVTDLIAYHNLLQYTHNLSDAAATLYQNNRRIYKTFWTHGLPDWSRI